MQTIPIQTTRAEQVFITLRTLIVEGQLTAGSKISEPELAKRFDVSRGTLRDALSRLEGCRLLERKANVGYRVVQLSVKQLLDLFHIRESLEGMACRLAAERMDKAQIEQLRSLLVKHGETSALQAGEAYIQEERDRDFHFCVVQGSGNSMLIKMLCDELYYLLRMYRYQFGMATARAQIAFSEHEHIVQAIANGDGELAEMLMRRHISASRKNVETHLANQLKQEAT